MSETAEKYMAYFNTVTDDLKLMYDYCGMSFDALCSLDFITFRRLFADAYIHKLKQTEDGKRYLEDCYIQLQTQPDKEAIRRFKSGVI